MQNNYGRTPLHVAATCGAVRTCDGIVEATTEGINRTDIFGTTALDNARAKKQDAVEAIILAKGGLPGDDPSLQSEKDALRDFVEKVRIADQKVRKMRVLEELPEYKIRLQAASVQLALKTFVEVRVQASQDISCPASYSELVVATKTRNAL